MGKVFPVRLLSRTATILDWRCPRARFWGNEYLGRGISKSSTSLALFTGISIHDSLAAIATFHQRGEVVPIDIIAETAYQQIYDNLSTVPDGEMVSSETEDFAKEQGSLTEGIIRGYYRHVWPRLLAQYPKIVAIEQEVEYKMADGFIFMAKPDLIMEDNEGEWHYIEFKSTSSKKASWINSWDTAVQLHSSIKAVEQTLGKAPIDVTILGMYKGYESYGKQSSVFCYSYQKKGNPPFSQDQIEYAYKAGFKRYGTWELPGGVKKWVEEMPEMILADQFPMTAPIYVNEDLVERFFAQRLIRETEIRDAMIKLEGHPYDEQSIMDTAFPQKFDMCVPSFGWSCEFKKLCHSNVFDPLSEGFELRSPHHAREAEMYAADT